MYRTETERRKLPPTSSKPGRTLDEDPEGLTEYTLPPAKFPVDDFKFIVLSGNYPSTPRNMMNARSNWKELEDEDEAIETAHMMWRPVNYGISGYEKINKRRKNSKFPLIFNHFESIRCISTKTGLIRTLKKYYGFNQDAIDAKYTVFHTTPTTFLVDDTLSSTNLQKNLIRHVEKYLPEKHWLKNLWLVKPEGLNRGRGIEVFNSLKDIMSFIGAKNLNMRYVVQKYIERPMLYHGRKFDIRVWAIYTGDDSRVYFYKRGYIRTSSDEFTTKINDNKAVHLTNNWFQQHLENYGKFEDGNTLSFEKMQEYIDEQFPEYNINFYDHFIKRMKDIAIDVYLAAKDEFNKSKREHCFELFGFDFMIDEDFRIWLIEWNTNPYFGIPNKFIADLLPRMISEMFEIIVDPIYPPRRKVPLPERNFELIYSPEKNTRQPFNTPLYPIREPEKLSPNSRKGMRSRIKKSRAVYKRNNSEARQTSKSIPRSICCLIIIPFHRCVI